MTNRPDAMNIYKEKTEKLTPQSGLSSSEFLKNRPRKIMEGIKPMINTKTEYTSTEVKDIYKEMLKDLELRSDLSF